MTMLGNISGGRGRFGSPLTLTIYHGPATGTDPFGRVQNRGAVAGWGDATANTNADINAAIQFAPSAPLPVTTGPAQGVQAGANTLTNLLNSLSNVVNGARQIVAPGSAPPSPSASPPVVQQGSRPVVVDPFGLQAQIRANAARAANQAQSGTVPWPLVFLGLAGVGTAVAAGAVLITHRRKR